jgi:xylulose-5-phosphate/fructose-6-phosphate phosphoketolase
MVVMNRLDRFHLVLNALERLPMLGAADTAVKEQLNKKLEDHQTYIETYGEDMPEIRNWKWELQ